MHAPQSSHLQVVERILRYLKTAPGQGLVYKPSTTLSLIVYSDADYVGSLDDRRFTIFFVHTLVDTLLPGITRSRLLLLARLLSYASAPKELRINWDGFTKEYFLKRKTLVSIFLLIDASIPPKKIDLEYAGWLGQNQNELVNVNGNLYSNVARRRRSSSLISPPLFSDSNDSEQEEINRSRRSISTDASLDRADPKFSDPEISACLLQSISAKASKFKKEERLKIQI
ncbi:GTP-binding protein [Platanthera zijinensis]|uniref:GTP-binding protein n=1 Tax=Platanthera zijinensis TaxID=2320716 RepID=A0AAP0FU67_9ASPA